MPYKKLNPQEILEVLSRYKTETTKALAAEFGVTPPTIVNIVKRHGLQAKQPDCEAKFNSLIPLIIQEFQQGDLVSVIATRHKVSRQGIYNLLYRQGLKKKPSSRSKV